MLILANALIVRMVKSAEATEMLDKKLESLGIKYARQYDLIECVLAADKKKMEKLKPDNITDKEII